jgi:UDP-N-acetylglucosamine:LPS N-acetylglucosamine transferase
VAELAVVGLGSILVPLPIATRDHQTANALPLVAAGAAVLVQDADFDADRLVLEADELTNSSTGRAKLVAMGESAARLAHPEAADRVADLVEQWALKPRLAN